mmetsp:Transcript_45776/g.118329  ORF Transcript_45776/g.118329 Transcript_45776/m.118329 type:complete len:128 (+) Transcript_45776:1348-1731(+)
MEVLLLLSAHACADQPIPFFLLFAPLFASPFAMLGVKRNREVFTLFRYFCFLLFFFLFFFVNISIFTPSLVCSNLIRPRSLLRIGLPHFRYLPHVCMYSCLYMCIHVLTHTHALAGPDLAGACTVLD